MSMRVERLSACAPGGVWVAVGVGEEGGVTEGVGVGVGEGLGVGAGVMVGVGVGTPSQALGPRIATVVGAPVLKKPMVAFVATGGLLESNRKLYRVPQRMAFAFWFCAKVSELQVTAPVVCVRVQGA